MTMITCWTAGAGPWFPHTELVCQARGPAAVCWWLAVTPVPARTSCVVTAATAGRTNQCLGDRRAAGSARMQKTPVPGEPSPQLVTGRDGGYALVAPAQYET